MHAQKFQLHASTSYSCTVAFMIISPTKYTILNDSIIEFGLNNVKLSSKIPYYRLTLRWAFVHCFSTLYM